jgi:catechol 2,3-dioxygenase-like lactoylglutathione lyase family enzyme
MGRMVLGHAQLCLNVKNLKRSHSFYSKLGFRRIGGNPKHNYVILTNGAWQLGLFQGHIPKNLVNFRGGDVAKLCSALKKKGIKPRRDARAYEGGGVDALIDDPDGNTIYLDTTPGERLYR